MRLKRIEITGFKSFAKKTTLTFDSPITAVVGPNGSGKSNIAEAMRWVLGEQSMKSLRGKRGEDLIWNGSPSLLRAGRASVALVFDNADKVFKIDFSELIISREVYRDGTNVYSVNGSNVRLRDVVELLAGVSLGPSGHHIISQGEADRVLSASVVERRQMLEDALGLKIYQFKLTESSKRFDKTEENIKQVESLRREIAPHLKFLRKQVEEAEKVMTQKEELALLSREYFINEQSYLNNLHKTLTEQSHRQKSELAKIEEELAKAGTSKQAKELSAQLAKIRSEKDEVVRQLGRLEGKIEAGKHEELVRVDEKGEERCRYCGQLIRTPRSDLGTLKGPTLESDSSHWREEKLKLDEKLHKLKMEEESLMAALEVLREGERVSYELRAREAALGAELEKIALREAQYKTEHEVFARDAHEISLLTGHNVLSGGPSSGNADRNSQTDLRKKIERLKIKVEDAGGIGSEIIKEYDDTRTRDEHLAKELDDLSKSAGSLESLMKELNETLAVRFRDGLKLVNKEFEHFFKLLFDGGQASVGVVKIGREVDEAGQEIGSELGIEIDVSLPRKKIKGLEMLSGGERALTSIALLFAMSQVNPPPFLVLDETDAALDEANSRKYGQMLENLSRKSQLIVVTHNRETMGYAQVLYGVTMGADGISKLLSIKFDDATVFAK